MGSRNPAVKDYYAKLGVPSDATQDVIKKAYRSLVQRYHPDRVKPQDDADFAYQRMVEINEAFAVLSDSKRRADHDRQRKAVEKKPSQDRSPMTPAAWETAASAPVTDVRAAASNPDLDKTVAQDFLQKLKVLVGQQGTPLNLREEREKDWLWSYLGKTWGRNYWISLRLCQTLSPSKVREVLVQLQALISKRRSGWKSNTFVFILAFHSLIEGENTLKMCRAYCNRKENSTRSHHVNIVVLDLKHRRSVLCGKRSSDSKLGVILRVLAAG